MKHKSGLYKEKWSAHNKQSISSYAMYIDRTSKPVYLFIYLFIYSIPKIHTQEFVQWMYEQSMSK
jgi:hypothetical protein